MSNRPKINVNEFFDELAARGFTHLFHSNSLETSISFFRTASLLSRDSCATQTLPMSQQWSDSSDQEFGIWSDIFLNLNDQHIVFKGPNKYGPILFSLNAERLRKHLLENNLSLSITKAQPHNWQQTMTDNEKWQNSFEGIFKNPPNSENPKYLNGWPDVVISGTNHDGLPIHLCDSVIVDQHPSILTYYSQVDSIFQTCLSSHRTSVLVSQRTCFVTGCKCKTLGSMPTGNFIYKYETLGWESEYGKIA